MSTRSSMTGFPEKNRDGRRGGYGERSVQIFLTDRPDILLFFNGALFLLMAVIAYLLFRSGSGRFSWGMLVLYGIVAGIGEWAGVLPVDAGTGAVAGHLRLALGAGVSLCLIEFARRTLRDAGLRAPGWWILPVLIVPLAVAVSAGQIPAAFAYVHIGMGMAADSMLGAMVYALYRRRQGPAPSLALLLCAAYVVMRGAIITASLEANANIMGGPIGSMVAWPKLLVLFCVCMLLWMTWRDAVFADVIGEAAQARLRVPSTLVLLISVLVCGALAWQWIEIFGARADHAARREFLTVARTACAGIDPDLVRQLRFSPRDPAQPDYRRLREQLTQILRVDRRYRQLYLVAEQRPNVVSVLADSGPENSPGYSPPGSEHTGLSPLMLSVIRGGGTVVTGPLKDRRGTWMSTLVPVRDRGSGRTLAAFGMDLDHRDWLAAVRRGRLQGFSLSVIFLLVLLAALLVYHLNIISSHAMLASVRQFRALFESAPEAIVIFEVESRRIMAVNTAFEKLIGSAPGTLPADKIDGLRTDAQGRVMGDPGSAHTGSRLIGGVRYRRCDGAEFDAEETLAPVQWHDKDCVMAYVRNVTERTRAEIQLREALSIRSRFVSVVSHELRTPLTAIREGLNIITKGMAGPIHPEQAGFIDIISRNVDRLSRLINEVLDFQKLDAGREQFLMQVNDIGEIIRDAYRAMSPAAAEKNLAISLRVGPELPRVSCDRGKILQVVMNLLGNAVKFTARGGIVVSCAHSGNIITVTVKDTGEGIPPEQADQLFKVFSQVGTTLSRRAGSGLGLAIARGIIERHGGRIWAVSSPGTGSAFSFLLPVVEKRARPG